MNTMTFRKVSILCLTVILLAGFAISPIQQTAHAQDAAVVCDSTLAVLLLVAEHDYDYLSSMMMSEDAVMMPHFDLGQYQPLVDEIVAMMMEMAESGEMAEGMTEEDMAAHDEALGMYMEMSDSAAMVAAYLEGMGMAMDSMSSTVLTPGNVAGEDPACAAARASVENFLLAHIITEMGMSTDEM
jgi:hypothetical protein